jgi:hypothetical protein
MMKTSTKIPREHRMMSFAPLGAALLLCISTGCGGEMDGDEGFGFRTGSGTSGWYESSGDGGYGSSSWGSSTSTSTGYGSSSWGSSTSTSTGYGSSSWGSSTSTSTSTSGYDSSTSGSTSTSTSGGTSGGDTGDTGWVPDLGSCGSSGGESGGCDCEDPDGIRPPSNEANCNYNYQQTCQIINGITVCDNEYIPGEYMCGDFADDFCEACETAGVPSWKMVFGCGYYRNWHWCAGYDEPSFYHATNIVEVDFPGPNRKFCVIEPQSNTEVTCWVSAGGPTTPLPGFVITALHTYYDAWGWQDCLDEGWDEVFDIE